MFDPWHSAFGAAGEPSPLPERGSVQRAQAALLSLEQGRCRRGQQDSAPLPKATPAEDSAVHGGGHAFLTCQLCLQEPGIPRRGQMSPPGSRPTSEQMSGLLATADI